ncbi:MAG: HAD-IIA family hydrolase [Aureliella sp.]
MRRIAHVALDMDGTIYNGDTLLACTVPFLAQLRQLGIGCSFVTNNPSKSVGDSLKKLASMGLDIEREQLFTSSMATMDVLRREYPSVQRLFVLGTPSMCQEFMATGFQLTADDPDDVPDAVVVGFDMTLSYDRLCRAAWWIQQRLPYLATNPDRVCPTDQRTVLVDCGSICAMLEKATGRAPDKVLGKPDPDMIQGIVRRWSIGNDQIAMVGDRLYTDILMAHRAGALGVMVLTGEGTLEDAAGADPPPDIVVPSLAEFGELLAAAKLQN